MTPEQPEPRGGLAAELWHLRQFIIEQHGQIGWVYVMENAVAEVERLALRVKELEDALRPFADEHNWGNAVPSNADTDNWKLNQFTALTYGDLKRAAAALTGNSPEGKEGRVSTLKESDAKSRNEP